MKKYLLLFVTGLCFSAVGAQLVKQEVQTPKKQSDLDWYNCSFDQDGVYGAEVNKAYEFLKEKKIKKRPVVALIGTGLDVEHEDLKQAVWVNPKEKANGKDDDKNGLVDDINGWNFLGGKDGRVMETITREGDREFFRLKDKYADYITSNGEFFKIIDGKRTLVPAPENLSEYVYYKTRVLPESEIAKKYGGWQIGYVIREYGDKFKSELETKYPRQKITKEQFQTCYDPNGPVDTLRDIAFTLIALGFQVYKTEDLSVVYENFVMTAVERAEVEYMNVLKRYGNDGREDVIGDNYLDCLLYTSDAADE